MNLHDWNNEFLGFYKNHARVKRYLNILGKMGLYHRHYEYMYPMIDEALSRVDHE
jgi:hypothetical protein